MLETVFVPKFVVLHRRATYNKFYINVDSIAYFIDELVVLDNGDKLNVYESALAIHKRIQDVL